MSASHDDFEFLFDSEKVSRFLDRLKASGKRRVGNSEIWSAFAETYRDIPQGPDGRRCLMRLLRELEASEVLRLPVGHGTRWDRNSTIPTPTSIDLKIDEKRTSTEWRDYPWHPRLQWVLNRSQLSEQQCVFLKKIQQGLVDGWFETLAPLKYRSLQLTGDEKKLVSLCKTRLFGEGRLTLSMLGCDPDILPMVIERVSDAADFLIFENAAPYMLARNVLRASSNPPVGRIAYGSGHQVGKSIEYIALLEAPVRNVFYVGDLDMRGIYIAAKLQSHCAANDLARVHPATVLHEQMLASANRLGAPRGWPDQSRRTSAAGDWVFQFLEPAIRDEIKTIVDSGHRIPEETLTESDLIGCFSSW